jgi:hypothetical protein
LLQQRQADLADLGDQRFVLRPGPVPLRLAAFAHQVVDRVDRDLHLLVAEHHGAQHHVFRQLVGFRFHHQHGALGTGNHQVQIRRGDLRAGRVQQVLAVLVADAGGADGPLNGMPETASAADEAISAGCRPGFPG